MNTIGCFHMINHSILGEDVIACDTHRLHVREATSPVYHSLALHAVSEEVLGWDLSVQSAPYRSLQRAIQASCISGRRFDMRAPCYIVDIKHDTRRITRALNRHGVEVQVCNCVPRLQKGHFERFFRDVNRIVKDEVMTGEMGHPQVSSLTLTSQLQRLKCALQFYHNRTSVHQPAAQTFTHQASSPSSRNRNQEGSNDAHPPRS